MSLIESFLLMLYFFLFIAWIWLFITVAVDIMRSDDLGGVAKALWVLFVLILPYLGVLIYLIARGGSMQQRAVARAQATEQAAERYIREVAGAPSAADELTKLAELRDSGVISPAEFDAQKAKLLT